MSNPAPDPTTKTTPTPAIPEFRRCRALTILGVPCRQRAQRGKDLCVAHARNRFPVCPQGDRIAVPLLEDLPTIRVVATQVAHGLFTQILDPWRAGKILYALQVAASTLPRPVPVAATNAQLAAEQPVTETTLGPDGHILGPEEKWIGPGERFEPRWSHDKYLYDQECERLGKPKPKGPADMPPSGWLTEEEIEEQKSICGIQMEHPFKDRKLQLRIDADHDGKLPPLKERPCSFGNESYCKGPGFVTSWCKPCHYCAIERDEHLRVHPEDAAPNHGGKLELNASAQDLPAARHPRHAEMLSTQYTPLTSIPAVVPDCAATGGWGRSCQLVRSARPQLDMASVPLRR